MKAPGAEKRIAGNRVLRSRSVSRFALRGMMTAPAGSAAETSASDVRYVMYFASCDSLRKVSVVNIPVCAGMGMPRTSIPDYAMLVKLYGEAPEQEKRYSPLQCTGCRKTRIEGHPDSRHVSTSFVERLNLTPRMSMRRFTRLTNAFSKKIENLEAAVALHFMWYNFGRVHQTLRVTPAMQAGVSDHVWSIEEVVALLDSN